MSYKNIVFDVGQVLIAFDYRNYMRRLGFSEEVVELFAKNMVETEFWDQLDLGVKMEADARETFSAKFPDHKEEVKLFWDNIMDIVYEYDYSVPMIQTLKDHGWHVYILSNYPIETAELHWPTFKFLPLTEGHIISGFEKVAKPDPKIFKLLESRFGLDLTESIFVDDRQVNIDGAEAVGMKGILFEGYEELMSKFKEMGFLD